MVKVKVIREVVPQEPPWEHWKKRKNYHPRTKKQERERKRRQRARKRQERPK